MKYLIALAITLFLPVILSAEPVDYEYTEPTASGDLAYTTVWWCKSKSNNVLTCTTWIRQTDFVSDDGNGNDVKTLSNLNIPISQDEPPIYLHMCATATNESGNTSVRGACDVHAF